MLESLFMQTRIEGGSNDNDVTDETGLQAYWKMTENVGTSSYDYSGNTDSLGNRYDGTITGSTWEAIE